MTVLKSIAIVLWLVGPVSINVDISSLLGAQLCQIRTDLLQMQTRHFLIQVLGQHVNLTGLVLVIAREEFDLSNRLVGK